MFKKATKQQAKVRIMLVGPSGSGKTMSALRIASGLGGTIAVIDTERGSASKYSDRFAFDVAEISDRTPEGYQAAIHAAGAADYGVLIIDSLSHAWRVLLAEVEKRADARFRGNKWSAWSEGTPRQEQLIDTILNFPGHVIATCRVKTEWTQEQDGNGKVKPVKVGLAPVQGKDIEYEFDQLITLTPDHQAVFEKDRSGQFQDKIIDKPGEELGKSLAAWLGQGAPPPAVPAEQKQAAERVKSLIAEYAAGDKGKFKTATAKKLRELGVTTFEQADAGKLAAVADAIEKALQQRNAEAAAKPAATPEPADSPGESIDPDKLPAASVDTLDTHEAFMAYVRVAGEEALIEVVTQDAGLKKYTRQIGGKLEELSPSTRLRIVLAMQNGQWDWSAGEFAETEAVA